ALTAAGLVAWRQRRLGGAVLLLAAAFPWFVLHHAVTYAYAGRFGPPNADPAVFDYPGTEFEHDDLTGRYNHASVGGLLLYAVGLLVGPRGFVQSNLPLFLAVPAPLLLWLLPRPVREWPEVVAGAAWAVGVWLVFALLSSNYSGECCSVRWFLPLLVP